jgi:hypothetical protein
MQRHKHISSPSILAFYSHTFKSIEQNPKFLSLASPKLNIQLSSPSPL